MANPAMARRGGHGRIGPLDPPLQAERMNLWSSSITTKNVNIFHVTA